MSICLSFSASWASSISSSYGQDSLSCTSPVSRPLKFLPLGRSGRLYWYVLIKYPFACAFLTLRQLNSATSFVSDYCWAYAMLLTTPLIVSVGLSLTIPISLIGQIILSSQSASLLYWAGAAVVVLSFLFINHESHDIGDETTRP